MSIKAYKLIEIKHEKEFTFNCSEITNLGEYEGDILTFEKDDIEDAITTYNKDTSDNLATLKAILKDMQNEDYVEYYCF